MSAVQDNWAETSIADINRYQSTVADPSRFPHELFELYSVPAYPSGRPDIALGSMIGSTKQWVQPGDVLLCKINPRLNRVWVVHPAKAHRQIASSEWIVVRSDSVVPEYLRAYFSASDFRAQLEADVVGVGGSLTRAQPAKVRELQVPLAPKAEQQRIVVKLNTLLSRVDGCRERLERVGPLIKRFRQSVLQAATSGELTAEWRAQRASPAWRPVTLGDLALDVRYGTSKKCEHSAAGFGVLRIPNITATGSIDPADLKFAEFEAGEIESLSLKVGDLLVIRSNGSLDLVGRTAVVDAQTAGLLYAGYLIRLRLNQAQIDPAFAYFCMASPTTRRLLTNSAKSTSGVNNVNAGELRALPISLPPLDEQQEVVRRVNRLLKFAEGLEQRLAAALQGAVRLTPAVLAKAFRGELVAQDPNDEPAEVLLARIRAEREGATPPPSRRRRAAGPSA